jgi:CRP-like cAMP-binding protein
MITESKITLMTTATVFGSFKRKYSAVSGLHPQFIQKLVTFRPMFLDEPNIWNGASFRFFYSLHSIPCVGFEVSLEDKSLVYSGDTFYDPAGLAVMRDSGVLSNARYNRLMDFPWHCDVVLHEAGVPPIHTPVEALAQLPEECKRNIHLIHIDGKAARMASDLGFRVASPGVENTLTLLEQKPEHGMLKFLQLVGSMEIFKHFHVGKALELMLMCTEVRYAAGSLIARKDDPGNKFIILLEGVASVTFEGVKKVFRSGDYLGEISSTTGQTRSASILAETNVTAMEMDQYALNYLMMNDRHLRTRLEHVVHARSDGSWQAIAHNAHMSMLTTAQKTQIQALLTRRVVKRGDVLWARGDPVTEAVLIQSGMLIFEEVHGTVEEVVAGMGRLRSSTRRSGNNRSSTKLLANVSGAEESLASAGSPGVVVVGSGGDAAQSENSRHRRRSSKSRRRVSAPVGNAHGKSGTDHEESDEETRQSAYELAGEVVNEESEDSNNGGDGSSDNESVIDDNVDKRNNVSAPDGGGEEDDDDDDKWTAASANQALLSTGMMLFDLLGINDERPLTTTLVCASKTAQIFTLDADAMLLFLDTNPMILLALLKTPILT